jgi:hypothetical protein
MKSCAEITFCVKTCNMDVRLLKKNAKAGHYYNNYYYCYMNVSRTSSD